MPESIRSHIAFVHNNAVTLCGGRVESGDSLSTTSSCLVLDVENQRWEKNVIGDLTKSRTYPAAVSVENVGTYLIGGSGSSGTTSSTDFLAHGLTEWKAGPDLPVSIWYPCAVQISHLSFLVIHGSDIREYQVDVANPTSSSGWQEANKWPSLQTWRGYHPGCTLTADNKVVIAGGHSGGNSGTFLKSSEVLDLATRKVTNGGDMTSPKGYFHLATITLGGATKIFAIGGDSGSSHVNSVAEEFHIANNSWTMAPTTLAEEKGFFGQVVIQLERVCPNREGKGCRFKEKS